MKKKSNKTMLKNPEKITNKKFSDKFHVKSQSLAAFS
jgi:hypothetical protein